MNENRGTTVLLTVIGIATLLVAVVGATFAYFTATVEGNDNTKTDVTVNSATLGTITFSHGNVIDLCDEETLTCTANSPVYPGAQEAKTFTVKADPKSTVAVDYSVYLNIITNGFTSDNLGYKISAVSAADADVTVPEGQTRIASSNLPAALDTYTSLGNKTGEVKIADAKLGTHGTVDTWTLDVMLANVADAPQNEDQGKTFTAQIVVKADTKYTTDENGNVTVYTTTENTGA